jgi:membrane-bound lytic murein transglycosylase B
VDARGLHADFASGPGRERATVHARVVNSRAMKRLSVTSLAAAALCAAAFTPAAVATSRAHPGQAEFVREVLAEAKSRRPDLTAERIDAVLNGAVKQQGIIDAMTRPAEAKPWHQYRPIFLTAQRIDGGVRFWREHAALLEPVAARYGVPPEVIVAIIGVETAYGANTGRWRVLDALATLAFHYPPRAPYFRGELKRLFLIEDRLPQPIDQVKGSYAGAMGLGQFMPTSYANWAVDHDDDGAIDLWNDDGDIFASVANYFVAHGWEPGRPVADAARVGPDARAIRPEGFEPVYSVGQLAQWGYHVPMDRDADLPATLLRLDGTGGDEYWVTYRNFFVITRYNRSPLYSLAVWQLAQEIAAAHRLEVEAR